MEDVPVLIELLKTTQNHLIRDAATLALRDLKDERAIKPLVSLIKDPKTARHRGTLVYALEVFDGAVILPFLVDLVMTGNFETRHEAFLAIESTFSVIDENVLQVCLKKVEDALAQTTGERAEWLTELVNLLNEWN